MRSVIIQSIYIHFSKYYGFSKFEILTDLIKAFHKDEKLFTKDGKRNIFQFSFFVVIYGLTAVMFKIQRFVTPTVWIFGDKYEYYAMDEIIKKFKTKVLETAISKEKYSYELETVMSEAEKEEDLLKLDTNFIKFLLE